MTSTLDGIVDRVLFDLDPRYDFSIKDYSREKPVPAGFVKFDHGVQGYLLMKSSARGGLIGMLLGYSYATMTGSDINESMMAGTGYGMLIDATLNSIRGMLLVTAQIFGMEKYKPYRKPKEISSTTFENQTSLTNNA